MKKILLAGVMALGLAAQAQAADHLTLQLKWVTQAQFAGYYVAAAEGYYKAANLDVTIKPGGPDINPSQVIPIHYNTMPQVETDAHAFKDDVGSGAYTARTFSKDRYTLWFNTSPYHNLPTIGGREQGTGGNFAARDVRYQDGKLSLNITGAYPAEAGISPS